MCVDRETTRAIQKSLSLNETGLRIFWRKKSQENGPLAESDKTERVRGLGRKNKRGDKKEESNDSPEIPDRGFQQTSPASLRGESRKQTVKGRTKRKGQQKVVNKQ